MTDNTSPPSNDALESALHGALEGDRGAIERFLEAFLRGPLWIPTREQRVPLAGLAETPPSSPDLLAVDDRERVIVPVFSNEDAIRAWCAAGLRFRTLSGEQLTAMLPEDWWVVVNAGGEVEKELTPWELSELRRGSEAFPSIIDEILSQDESVPFEIEAPAESEYGELKQAVLEAAAARREIAACYLARERVYTDEGEAAQVLVLGVDTSGSESEDERRAIRSELEPLTARLQIGAEPVRIVLRGEYGSELLFVILEKFEPFYRGKAGGRSSRALERIMRGLGFKRSDR